MISATKAKINHDQIIKITQDAFGREINVSSIVELTEGYYNAAYVVTVNGQEVIIKVAPPDDADILTYEESIMEAELEIYRLIEKYTEVPIPKILKSNVNKDIIPFKYYIMEKLEGIPLNKISDKLTEEEIYKINLELIKYMALIGNIKRDFFGYYKENNSQYDTYKETFIHMFNDVIQDGNRKNVMYPMNINDIRNIVVKHISVFDNVTEASVVHFDLWEGNIFIKKDSGKLTVEGIIDCERGFYGDRLAEFVPLKINIFEDKNRNLLNYYNQYSSDKLSGTNDEITRYKLHRIYLLLIMVVECSYRGVDGSFDDQYKWASNLLVEELKRIEED